MDTIYKYSNTWNERRRLYTSYRLLERQMLKDMGIDIGGH